MRARTKGLLAFCILATALVSVPAAAQAKPPKWLLPPYRFYTLTYEATTSFKGTAVDTYPIPTEYGDGIVEGLCEHAETSIQLDGSMHARVRIGFVFGRYRHHGRTVVLSSHRALGHSAGGVLDESGNRTVPAGCPPDSAPYLRLPWSCHRHYQEDEAPELGLHASHQLRRWRAEISPRLGEREEAGACQGEPDELSADYGGLRSVMPGAGSISYTIGGILAGRTFRGQIATDPAEARSGEGTVPQSEEPWAVDPQSVWRSQVEVHANLTMAPTHKAKRRSE